MHTIRIALNVNESLLAEVQQAHNLGSDPVRCAMLDSLFSWGSVTDWDFPSGMATFQ